MKVLLVEDHEALGALLAAHFAERGVALTWCRRGEDALHQAASHDVALLDLTLPDMDGMEVLRRWREGPGTRLPVLILTARDRVASRIAGLDEGADDYILKPFDLGELEARLRAVLRRPGPRAGATLRFGDIAYEPAAKHGAVGTAALELTRLEAALLEALLAAMGRIVVRDAIIDQLYGVDGEVSGNAIEAIVSRLRRKLGAAGSSVKIDAMRGVGYRLRGRD